MYPASAARQQSQPGLCEHGTYSSGPKDTRVHVHYYSTILALGRIFFSVFDTHTAGIRPIPNGFPSNKDCRA